MENVAVVDVGVEVCRTPSMRAGGRQVGGVDVMEGCTEREFGAG